MATAVTSCLAGGLHCTKTKFPRLSTQQRELINSGRLALCRSQAGTENTLKQKVIAREANTDPSSGLPGACPVWADSGSDHQRRLFSPSTNCLPTCGFLSEDPPLVHKVDNSLPSHPLDSLVEFAGLEKRQTSSHCPPPLDRQAEMETRVHGSRGPGHDDTVYTHSSRLPTMSIPTETGFPLPLAYKRLPLGVTDETFCRVPLGHPPKEPSLLLKIVREGI